MTIKILNKPSPKLLTTWYAEQVVQEKMVASEYVKKECERHLKYLKSDSNWVFDEELAHRPIRFIEKFCKPSKGDFDSLILQPWQHFIIGSLFGWVQKETRIRRFKEGVIFMGRKNGKTTMNSGVSNYGVSQDGENGAEVHLLANVMKQARILFDESKAMIQASPKLNQNFRPLRDEIRYDKTFSKIMPQASDSEKLDGLNTHMAIFDEIHEFKDYKLINVIKNSRAARKQPLIIYITTAGTVLDGPLIDMVEAGRDVLDGAIEDERTFYFLASLDDSDDINDPDNWIKANPNLGVSINLDEMKEEWNKAKRVPAERSDFVTKRFNIFANNDEMGFIDYDTLKKNNDVISFDELVGKPCTVGYDLSETEDFTAAVATFALDDGRIAVFSHSWIPKKKVELSNERIPYREWEEDGFLTIQDKSYIDYQDVFDWIVKINKHHPVEKICYDRANAYKLNQELKNYGFLTEETRQGSLTLSPALKDLKEMFLDGKVVFNNNPLMKWYINNVHLKKDRNGNWLPSKQGRYRKIDGFAALLNTYTDIMNKIVNDTSKSEIEFISIKDLRS
ncbi:terminase large subunit [Staphylococcus muscae]|uniref:Terminase large subunit n=1 Tax=Staphylococcus muscae TaxID=1294 RepID=A0A240BYG2_9STAP|nr:terminase TerL endonuclease subunit [Staphylococcus muscae]AVQ34415.1 terminase large subunit [Staphylococcus muscae]PNZ03552.1 terminase large subunit [Staphylococcus muscae]GGA93276.1 phage terminase large subunit [Staphylococcus muscae]SNW00695.1 terminase large subunit [Staphylococcus muscae]